MQAIDLITKRHPITAAAFAAAVIVFAGCAPAAKAVAPGPVYSPLVPGLRADALADAKSQIQNRDKRILPAFEKLLDDAAKQLKAPIVAVTDKHTLLPPSGNKHDYFSLSPYWWPDPSQKDGLPYIRRDGETNPESKRDLDQPRVAQMGYNVQTLALAYYLTGDEKYAARAAKQLKAWFLDPETMMTPHLRFSQLVRGNPEERGSGIIDTRWFIEATQAAGLLRGSNAWTTADNDALKLWFKNYLSWLTTSPNGAHEREAKNNHGSWYAAQTAAYALFIGDTARARQIAEGAKARIGWQIQPDGNQPIEMERTRSMHYSGFNIEALSRVAEIGRTQGVDLWNYTAPNGGSLKAAIDHLAKYIASGEKWPGQQLDEVDPDLLIIHLRRAKLSFGGNSYDQVLARMPKKLVEEDRSALLYPDH